MQRGGNGLAEVLSGFDRFLIDKCLVPDNQRPYLVRWVRDFLLFARANGGYTFEQTLDMFLAEVRSHICLKFTPFSWYNTVMG